MPDPLTKAAIAANYDVLVQAFFLRKYFCFFLTCPMTFRCSYLQQRPEEMEVKCIKRILDLAYGNLCYGHRKSLHFVSLSSSTAMSMIQSFVHNVSNARHTTDTLSRNTNANNNNIDVSSSTCPHYLIFDSSDCSNGCKFFLLNLIDATSLTGILMLNTLHC